jgi:non-specific serine/threonine protein kinase
MTAVYEIGPFRLDAESGVLLRLGMAEPLGKRAVKVLATLVKSAHKPVTKDAIIDAAWPGLVVEEANLTVQMSSIRRVLSQAPGGDRWIETLAGRGYRFVGPVTELHDDLGDARREICGNLGEPLTSFVGRERELVELKRLLAKSRLLTVTGVGGIGKTRLALQVAAEIRDTYRDGAWFVDFATLDDSTLVPSAVAQALGVPNTLGKPLVESLCRHSRSRRLLLILDNCEHVIDAAARLAETMLLAAADLTIIATSREPLRIGGEQLYGVSPLPLPDPAAGIESIGKADAVALFVDRARRQQPDFVLSEALAADVARLCIRLDGIPFALELAAALLRTHSIDAISVRLDDRFNLLTGGSRTAPPRQQTLRATLDWSHDLLTEAERTVLSRSAVFLGSFTSTAVATVASDETKGEAAVCDALVRLVNRSLVVFDANESRYRLLETVREYALEKLRDRGELQPMRRRHARCFRGLFEQAPDDWLRLPDAVWQRHYLPERDNVRAALEYALSHDCDPAAGVALAAASGPMWTSLGLDVEGVQRLKSATARIDAETPARDQARLWFWLGVLASPAPPIEALEAFERATALYRQLDDAASLGHSLARLARVLALMGKFDRSAALLTEAHTLLEGAGVPRLLAIHFHQEGFLKLMTGDLRGARAHYETSFELYRDSGASFSAFNMQMNFADVSWALGDIDGAIDIYRGMITTLRKRSGNGNRVLGSALTFLAGALTERGRYDEALAAAREGLPLEKDYGQRWIAFDLLALRAALVGNSAAAARIAGYADSTFAKNRALRPPNEARAHARLHALLCERLDPSELERLLASGAGIDEDEACRLALEA